MPYALVIIGACALVLYLLNGVQVEDLDAERTLTSGAGDSVDISAEQALQCGNVRAFLLMIRYAEGTAGPNGYSTLFGGGTFNGFADHPRIVVTATLGGRELKSSAAGAYQIIKGTWDTLQIVQHFPDFAPHSQDLAAVELLRRRDALRLVIEGNITAAINAARKEWASLPGAGYGQPERKLSDLIAQYQSAGGSYA